MYKRQVETISQTLPICKVRQVAYSTVTILQIRSDGEAYMVQFDNPLCVLLRDGKRTEYPIEMNIISDKTVYAVSYTHLCRGMCPKLV